MKSGEFKQYGIEPLGEVGGTYKYDLPILNQEWVSGIVGVVKKVCGKFDPDTPIDYQEGLEPERVVTDYTRMVDNIQSMPDN